MVALAFSFGMSKITELSLGSLNGQGLIDLTLPDGETVYIHATWGLSVGFYLCIIAAVLLICTGLIDFITNKKRPKRFFKSKK